MKTVQRLAALAALMLSLSMTTPASANPMWFNMRLGPAIGASNSITQFGLEFDFGIEVIKNGSVIIPLGFGFGNNNVSFAIPVGFQYDIQIPGVKNFYLYPRISIGYVASFPSGNDSQHFFLIDPGFGLKYVFNNRFQVGFEPFRLPIAIGEYTAIQYRLFFYGGLRF